MRSALIPLFCLAALLSTAQDNPNYDSTLALALGADDYGMKSYILVILKTGTKTVDDVSELGQLFRGHLENISRLATDGKLVVAGPLGKNDHAYRGIFILNVASKEEANDLLQTDPAIAADVLAADLYDWYGSAALPVYLETHGKIEKMQPR